MVAFGGGNHIAAPVCKRRPLGGVVDGTGQRHERVAAGTVAVMAEDCAMRRSGFLLILAGLVAASMVAGCRKEEQGRILSYDKGTYLGSPEARLSEDTRVELRQRVKSQGSTQNYAFLGGGPGPSSAAMRSSAGRGGAVSNRARDAARSRIMKQGMN